MDRRVVVVAVLAGSVAVAIDIFVVAQAIAVVVRGVATVFLGGTRIVGGVIVIAVVRAAAVANGLVTRGHRLAIGTETIAVGVRVPGVRIRSASVWVAVTVVVDVITQLVRAGVDAVIAIVAVAPRHAVAVAIGILCSRVVVIVEQFGAAGDGKASSDEDGY